MYCIVKWAFFFRFNWAVGKTRQLLRQSDQQQTLTCHTITTICVLKQHFDSEGYTFLWFEDIVALSCMLSRCHARCHVVMHIVALSCTLSRCHARCRVVMHIVKLSCMLSHCHAHCRVVMHVFTLSQCYKLTQAQLCLIGNFVNLQNFQIFVDSDCLCKFSSDLQDNKLIVYWLEKDTASSK